MITPRGGGGKLDETVSLVEGLRCAGVQLFKLRRADMAESAASSASAIDFSKTDGPCHFSV
jgi:hypothetical protein